MPQVTVPYVLDSAEDSELMGEDLDSLLDREPAEVKVLSCPCRFPHQPDKGVRLSTKKRRNRANAFLVFFFFHTVFTSSTGRYTKKSVGRLSKHARLKENQNVILPSSVRIIMSTFQTRILGLLSCKGVR